MNHPLYDYGPPVVESDGGTPHPGGGEIEDAGGGAVPHTPPANTGLVSPPGGSPSFESGEQPFLASIAPVTAVVGGADLTLTATGTGFTSDSKISFNEGIEPTTFVSATSLTTTVKPSLASGAAAVPVKVVTGASVTAPKTFTFTAT